MKAYLPTQFTVERDPERCTQCKACIKQCTFGVHYWDDSTGRVRSRQEYCVGCHRCEALCPADAITVRRNPPPYRENHYWQAGFIADIVRQADTGGVALTGMGSDRPQRVYWDHLLLDASQVTNPSIDPLREPMELDTYLGQKPEKVEIDPHTLELKTEMAPQIRLETPIMFAAMSYGAVSLNVQESLARAAQMCGTLWNAGEGGLHTRLYPYGANTVVQVASGRFGVSPEYLRAGAMVEIKVGQGAKPGIGGHLPAEKVNADVARTRMIPQGTDALSPAPHHDIYSIEDLSQLIYALKEATDYAKPVSVKIAAVHNAAAIASGMVRAGADVIVLDGFRGSTGAAPKVIRDNTGIPIEMALAAVDTRLRQEGIRHRASVVISGGIRNSGDVAKAIALGADAVYVGTAALVALGCTICGQCHTGRCPWGICTTRPELVGRVNPEQGAGRLANLLHAWSLELKDILGSMGINAIESLRGNRLHLRGIGLTDAELDMLGVRMVGA